MYVINIALHNAHLYSLAFIIYDLVCHAICSACYIRKFHVCLLSYLECASGKISKKYTDVKVVSNVVQAICNFDSVHSFWED
jgi:hypothetical protein